MSNTTLTNNLRNELAPKSSSQGWSKLSISLASIIKVYAEELRCDIKVVQGEKDEPIYSGVEIILPAFGARHFLGAIPDINDLCIVGWMSADQDGKRKPAILGWFPKSPFLGHDWLPTQSTTTEEGMLNTPKDRIELKGISHRIRNKLRHFQAGNIGASSSQGSDLVLDESVLLSNRRANEIRLRDQDQAFVVRSQQQFHTMSGARIYGGIVQRDARTLPKELISDGSDWSDPYQLDVDGKPKRNFKNDTVSQDNYKPHHLFRKESLNEKNNFEKDDGFITVDPYKFVYNANLVNEFFENESETRSLVYGGKAILRLNTEGKASFNTNMATEYRIELNHLTDGTLPVSEQTDGFDSDRLPDVKESKDKLPFVEFVLGSVVGNEAFTLTGKDLYGKPLSPKIEFGAGSSLVDASTLDLQEHSATLLKVQPVVGGDPASFISFTKGGALRAFIGNATTEYGIKAKVNSGVGLSAQKVHVQTTGNLDMNLGGQVSLNAGNNVDLKSNKVININAVNTINLSSNERINLSAPVVNLADAGQVVLKSQSALNFGSAESINISAKGKNETIMGGSSTTISGPKDFNMLSGPPRSTKILASPATGQVAGIVDEKVVAFGDELNTYLTTSNITDLITSGTKNTVIGAGALNMTVGANAINLTPASAIINATAGVATVNALSGIATLNGVASAVVNSEVVTTIRGGGALVLSSKGTSVGFIMCGSDRDTVTGLPYVALGLIPRGHVLAIG